MSEPEYVREKRLCANCGATGKVPGFLWERECPSCHGAGSMMFCYDPAIPKGIIDQMRATWQWPQRPASFLASLTGGLFS